MEEGRRAHHAGPRSKARRRDRPLFRGVISAEASSRRSSFMVTINVRTAGALPMVIAARAWCPLKFVTLVLIFNPDFADTTK